MIGAVLIGLFGSVHCLGMCGPLAMTFTKASGKGSITSFAMYHSGRLLVYGLIGILFGLLSLSMYFFQIQKTGAIVVGLLIVLIYGFSGIRNRMEGWYYQSPIYQYFRKNVTRFYNSRARWLAAGILNGLLPCGMVYLAAAGAVLTGGIWPAMQFMLLFGLGTLPMFLGIAILKGYAPKISTKLANLTTPIGLLAGMVLIVRGLITDNPNMNELLTVQVGKLMTVCGF